MAELDKAALEALVRQVLLEKLGAARGMRPRTRRTKCGGPRHTR